MTEGHDRHCLAGDQRPRKIRFVPIRFLAGPGKLERLQNSSQISYRRHRAGTPGWRTPNAQRIIRRVLVAEQTHHIHPGDPDHQPQQKDEPGKGKPGHHRFARRLTADGFVGQKDEVTPV